MRFEFGTIHILITIVSVLVAFLRTRIEDNAGVKEAAQGLRSLMEMNRFMKKDTIDIMETLFKNTRDLQRQPVLSRFAVYRLIEKALDRCREVLQGMNDRFIDGLLSLIEFEKDPRNLMIVFSSLHVVMAEFTIAEQQTVALWDAVFRYYPISYNPKPGDKVQITKQDLQQRLEACITSNSRFAPYALPSLLAKLDQELGVTVKVSLLTRHQFLASANTSRSKHSRRSRLASCPTVLQQCSRLGSNAGI